LTRHVVFLLIFSHFAGNTTAQRTFLDRASSGEANYLPIEGGSIYMPIDSTTSLDILIARLSTNWEFIETGKAYWIGYTNDMFSVAARGDRALGPLIHVVETSSSEKAKTGAIYTIHLIGIQRMIVGRDFDKFIDSNARKALLQLLKYPEWQPTIMELLIRDPWRSDVPELIACMNRTDVDSWAVVAGLLHYHLQNMPVHQKIPANLSNKTVRLRYSDQLTLSGDYDFEGQMQEALDSLIALKNDSIIVDSALLNRPLWGNWRHKLGSATEDGMHLKLFVADFLDPWGSPRFWELGTKIQYYIENGKLYICSAGIAKKRWEDWWAKLSTDEQSNFGSETAR
jgi:hypothetical protein